MATTKKEAAKIDAPAEGGFLWLGPYSSWSGPGGGLTLEHGQVYDPRHVDAAVLAEWIRSGVAQMVRPAGDACA